MARRKNNDEPEGTPDVGEGFPFGENEQDGDIPAGFRPMGPAQKGPPNYWKPSEGETLQGELVGRFRRPGNAVKIQFYYQIKLTKPCEALRNTAPVGEDAIMEEVKCGKGEVVNVDERKGIEDFADLLKDEGVRYEVFIRAVKKEKLQGGNTFWRMQTGCRRIS